MSLLSDGVQPRFADERIAGITHDSRRLRPGDLYVALPGTSTHGARFARQAVAAGAVAVLTDDAGRAICGELGVAVITVGDPRAILGPLAASIYGDPSAALAVYGVTGTNGKTTTAHLLDAGLRRAGRVTGLIGTVGNRIGELCLPSEHTTPEATELQALFAVMVERGLDAVAMEVSSHALALHRVDGTRFRAVAFTNLSQDHLDFHPSMEEYFRAKARLFRAEFSDRAVIDVDDPFGARLAGELRRADELAVATVSETSPQADWQISAPSYSGTGSTALLVGPSGFRERLSVRLPGPFNLHNAALAVAMLVSGGEPVAAVLEGVAALAGVPGRMQPVVAGQPFLAFVDYAHTPAAVARLLAALRAMCAQRVIVVLGCGGDRDRVKRPLMARAATAGADLAVFTSDNPRGEDPAAIVEDMLAGLTDRSRVQVELDRRLAIRRAIGQARPGDVLVVAGKGHERTQVFAERVEAFDDRVVLAEELAAAGWAEPQ
ncbi:MAG: UDP-N-acetylmuramoyl-L-alanyl-D-glutamate--2,6-diaminopimelate ligase [Mycobacteriales bacterium]